MVKAHPRFTTTQAFQPAFAYCKGLPRASVCHFHFTTLKKHLGLPLPSVLGMTEFPRDPQSHLSLLVWETDFWNILSATLSLIKARWIIGASHIFLYLWLYKISDGVQWTENPELQSKVISWLEWKLQYAIYNFFSNLVHCFSCLPYNIMINNLCYQWSWI